MLSLSDHYLAASSEADRAAAVAAGQTVLAIYKGTGFNLYIVLVSAGGVIVSAVMLRSTRFGKVAGSCGIAANLLNPGMFLPEVGLYIGFIALLPLLVWYVLVGRALLRLGFASPPAADTSATLNREPVSALPVRQVP